MGRVEKFFSRVGTLWHIASITLVMLVLGHYLLGGAELALNLAKTGRLDKVDARYAAPVYDGFAARVPYWAEFNKAWGKHFEPYFHWRRDPFPGKFITVDAQGVRHTPKPAVKPDARKVFMFGGSTMWGTGAPDDGTIPAYLQSMLGEDYDVVNYGETAYVSAQELNYLLYQLALGNVPDVVVFYDGVNDGYAGAYSPAIPRDPHNLRSDSAGDRNVLVTLFKNSNYKRVLDKARSLTNLWFAEPEAEGATAWDRKIGAALENNSRAVVDMYEAHIRQVKALGREYGFKALFFWQPNLYSLGRRKPNPYETRVLEESAKVLVESQRQVYLAAKHGFSNREPEGIYFLGDIFDQVDEPIYIDWHHIGPNGNEVIARAMEPHMRGPY